MGYEHDAKNYTKGTVIQLLDYFYMNDGVKWVSTSGNRFTRVQGEIVYTPPIPPKPLEVGDVIPFKEVDDLPKGTIFQVDGSTSRSTGMIGIVRRDLICME